MKNSLTNTITPTRKIHAFKEEIVLQHRQCQILNEKL